MIKTQTIEIKSELIAQKKLQVKLKLLINSLKTMNQKNVTGREKCQQKIAEQSYINSFKLESNTILLGIEPEPDKHQLPFSYVERTTIRNECFDKCERNARPLINYFNSKRNYTGPFNVFYLKQTKHSIDNIEMELKQNYRQLAIIVFQKVILLEKVAHIKAGEHLKDQLSFDYLKSKVIDLKTKLVADMVLHEICFRTEFAARAIQKIEKYLDEQIYF